MSRIEIRYSIHLYDEEVVGGGQTVEQAVFEVESYVCNGQWETTPGMPDPISVLSPGESHTPDTAVGVR